MKRPSDLSTLNRHEQASHQALDGNRHNFMALVTHVTADFLPVSSVSFPRYIQHFCPGLGWTPAKEPLPKKGLPGTVAVELGHFFWSRGVQEWTMTARDTICSKGSKVKERPGMANMVTASSRFPIFYGER